MEQDRDADYNLWGGKKCYWGLLHRACVLPHSLSFLKFLKGWYSTSGGKGFHTNKGKEINERRGNGGQKWQVFYWQRLGSTPEVTCNVFQFFLTVWPLFMCYPNFIFSYFPRTAKYWSLFPHVIWLNSPIYILTGK